MRPVVVAGVLVAALLAGLIYVAFLRGGTVYVTGTRAGDLDAGNEVGQGRPLRRGGVVTVAATEVKNVGHTPILVESVVPQSTSPELRTTRARVWVIPTRYFTAKVPTHYLGFEEMADGWPPNHPAKRPRSISPEAWVAPPPILSLPKRQMIEPGREVDFFYGLFLRADPSPHLRITALRITFRQGAQTFVWTLPNTVEFHSQH